MKKQLPARRVLLSLFLVLSVLAGCSNGAVTLKQECLSDADCAEGGHCIKRTCLLITPLGTFCEKDENCLGGICEDYKCAAPQCNHDSGCPNGTCESNRCIPPQCKVDGDCSDGICEGNKCVAPKCDASNPCAEGACEGGRCVTKCETEQECPGEQVCSKGVCKAVVCPSACLVARDKVCVKGDVDPAVGRCEDVNCGDTPCPLGQRCVSAGNPADPFEGECRAGCSIPQNDPDYCVLNSLGICLGVISQDPQTIGTCEAGCLKNGDCDAWEACTGASVQKLIIGTCKNKVPDAGSGKCRTHQDCPVWEKCVNPVQATLTFGDCEAVTVGVGQCREDNDCADPTPNCNGVKPDERIPGTCQA